MTFLWIGVKLLSTRKARVADGEDTETLSAGGEGLNPAGALAGGAPQKVAVRPS